MPASPSAASRRPRLNCGVKRLPGPIHDAEDALIHALDGQRADRLRTVAKQVREVAATLDTASRKQASRR